MKQYEGKELDHKIDSFLNRKFAKYPELSVLSGEDNGTKTPGFTTRIVDSLKNTAVVSLS